MEIIRKKYWLPIIIILWMGQFVNAQVNKTYYIDCKKFNKEKLAKLKKENYKGLYITNYSDTVFPADYMGEFVNIETITLYSLSTSEKHFNVNKTINSSLTIDKENLGSIQKVNSLTFFGFSFSAFPKELANLKSLRKLTINFSDLDSIPSSIQLFKDLEYLDLSTNRISCINPEIKNLSQLKTFSLANNKITKLPEELPKAGNCAIAFDNMYYGTTFFTNYNSFNLSDKSELNKLKYHLTYCRIAIETKTEGQIDEVKGFLGQERSKNLTIYKSPNP